MGGLTSLLLLLCVGVTLSAVLDLQKRIEGGVKCERQYHVKILNKKGKVKCGGSLLENNWILTAAHCNRSHMRVVLGAHLSLGQRTVMGIKKDPVVYAADHDIMLLKLPKPTMTQHVKLPDCTSEDLPKTVKQVQVAGYEGSNKETLKCIDMDVSPCEVATNHPEPDEYMFCGKSSGAKTCRGDSGGGVVFNGMIYGVHQGIIKNKEECAPLAAFVNVCRYKTWIQKETGIK